MSNVTPLYKDKSFVICFTICFVSTISLYHFVMSYTNFIIPNDRYYRDWNTGIHILDQFQRQLVNEAIILKNTYFGLSIINLIIFIASFILTVCMLIGYLDYYRGLIIEVIQYEAKPVIKTIIKNRPKQKIKTKTYTQEIAESSKEIITII